MHSIRSIALALPCVVILSAARSTPAADGVVLPLPAADVEQITARLGSGVVGQPLPSVPIGDPSLYFPLQERVAKYRVTTGDHTGAVQELAVQKGQRPSGNPAWRFALSPSIAGFISQTASGDLMMPAISDSGEGVIVVSTPANPFLISGMQPGETRRFSQSVAVNYLDDPTSRDYSGTLEGSYTYLGTFEVTVPAGTYPTIAMRLKYVGKIGPAHTEDLAYYFFAAGVGVVAMISQEDIEAFWIVHIDTKSGKVLMSAG
jgi:hypothetical protein